MRAFMRCLVCYCTNSRSDYRFSVVVCMASGPDNDPSPNSYETKALSDRWQA